MHTNPDQNAAKELHGSRSKTLPAQPKPGRALKLKTCPGCGERKAPTAFRGLKPGEPFRAKIRCRSCESHGGENLRRAHQREKILRSRPTYKFCRRCDLLTPLAEFRRDRRSADGRGGVCQACRQTKEKTQQEHVHQARRQQTWTKRRTLGLAIAHATCPPGHRRTLDEIAAYCGCSESAIRWVEEKALEKVLGPLRKILRKASMHVREVRL
jgi:hypothetical protein